MSLRIYLAHPRGFCAGVERAISMVERALALYGPPIYVRHWVVHNQIVVHDLEKKGAIFVEELSEIPDGQRAIFSAHGVSLQVQQEADRRGLQVFDATCPLVSKVHMEVMRMSRLGHDCVLIGHRGHPEVIGTMGHYQHAQGKIYLIENKEQAEALVFEQAEGGAYRPCGYVTQTTLSVDETRQIIEVLTQRFPQIHAPKREDICYATQNRQEAVRALAQVCDLILVVGSPESSNSNRLQELGAALGVSSYLLNDASTLQPHWLEGKKSVGITAGASAPEHLVQALIHSLQEQYGAESINRVEGPAENMYFPLPRELRDPVGV